MNDKAVQEDSNLVNSIISERREKGKKIRREDAGPELKKIRTQTLIQELRDKEERDSIDWDGENKEIENDFEEEPKEPDRDSVEVQEKEVRTTHAARRPQAAVQQAQDHDGAGEHRGDPQVLQGRQPDERDALQQEPRAAEGDRGVRAAQREARERHQAAAREEQRVREDQERRRAREIQRTLASGRN